MTRALLEPLAEAVPVVLRGAVPSAAAADFFSLAPSSIAVLGILSVPAVSFLAILFISGVVLAVLAVFSLAVLLVSGIVPSFPPSAASEFPSTLSKYWPVLLSPSERKFHTPTPNVTTGVCTGFFCCVAVRKHVVMLGGKKRLSETLEVYWELDAGTCSITTSRLN